MPPATGYAVATVPNPASGLDDFSLLIDLSRLPAGWWAEVNTNDATRGRAYKGDGTTELAIDWISFNSASDTGWARVKWSGTLPASGTIELRIYPPNTANASVAANTTYGQYSAYNSDWLGYWPMDEESFASGAADRTSNQNTATLDSEPGVTTGQIGTAADFNDDRLDVEPDASINNIAAGTFLAWAEIDTAGVLGSSDARLFDKGSGGDTSGGPQFRVDRGFNSVKFYGLIQRASGNIQTLSTTNLYDAGGGLTWFHVGMRWSVAGGYADTFVDGVDDTFTSTAGSGAQSDDSSRDLYLGNSVFRNRELVGGLDDVQLHGVELSDDWIAFEYSQQDQATFWGSWSYEAGSIEATPDPVSLALAIPSATISLSAVSLSPDATGLGLVVPTASITLAAVELSPDPVVLDLVVPGGGEANFGSGTGGASSEVFETLLALTVPSVTTSTGSVAIDVDPSVLGLAVPSVTISTGSVAVEVDPVVLALTPPEVSISIGALPIDVEVDPVVLGFAVPAPTTAKSGPATIPVVLELYVPTGLEASFQPLQRTVTATSLGLVVPDVAVTIAAVEARPDSVVLALAVPAVGSTTPAVAHVDPVVLAFGVPDVSLDVVDQLVLVEPVVLDLAVGSPAATYTGEAEFSPEPVVLGLVVVGTAIFYPGPYPAGQFYPFTTGPERRPAVPGECDLAFLIPDVEPLTVGEPPLVPVLVEAMEIRYRRRDRRTRSGQRVLVPTSTKLRPRFRVRWGPLTLAEREILRAWFRDELQGGRYAMTLRVDGPNTPPAAFRMVDPAAVNRALAVGVYDFPEITVEETFVDPGV